MADYYCTVRGTLDAAGVGEIFQHSLCVVSSASAQSVAQGLHDQWDQIWAAPDGSIANLFTPRVVYTETTAAVIMNRIEGTLSAAQHVMFSPPLAGTAPGGGDLPSQSAIAISIWGGIRDNGTPSKGRFYIPSVSNSSIVTGGLLSPAAQQSLLDAMVGLINGMNLLGHSPVVWSRKDGALRTLSKVRVGNQVDTIRRRRNAKAETYLEALVAP